MLMIRAQKLFIELSGELVKRVLQLLNAMIIIKNRIFKLIKQIYITYYKIYIFKC